MILDQVLAQGYLAHFDWGCKTGEHCGWVMIEAESEDEALMVVPALLRNKAQVFTLAKFSREDVESMHKAN